jgi:hypothetical protein
VAENPELEIVEMRKRRTGLYTVVFRRPHWVHPLTQAKGFYAIDELDAYRQFRGWEGTAGKEIWA